MGSIFTNLLNSLPMREALIVIAASIISVGGTRLVDYLANRLRNRAERETMHSEAEKAALALETEAEKAALELETERDRHSGESSSTKMRLIEFRLKEITEHNDTLLSLLEGTQATNTDLLRDNRKLNARVTKLEQQLAKLQPFPQELQLLRKRHRKLIAHV